MLQDPRVASFLAQIRQLHAMLYSVRQYPQTPAFEEERTAAALTLILYLRRTHRSDMYTKYVQYLSEMHHDLGNSAEAAHAQLLHAEVLEWTDVTLPAVRKGSQVLFPTETSGKRLERLLLNALHMFDEAQCWEEAVRIADRLRRHYTTVSFEYPKLSWLLKQVGRCLLLVLLLVSAVPHHLRVYVCLCVSVCLRLCLLAFQEAGLYEKLAHTPRFFSSYFLVQLFGPVFPDDIRGKQFVYRGAKVERVTDFERRLLAKWPTARKALPSEVCA